jgi:hypothetical protein
MVKNSPKGELCRDPHDMHTFRLVLCQWAAKVITSKKESIVMSDFLEFMDKLSKHFAFHLEIYYSKSMDCCITVYKQGCAKDYPKSAHDGDDAIICKVQDLDMALCFAKAHVAVKEWLIEHDGGY